MSTPGSSYTRTRLDRIRELVLPDARVTGEPCTQCGYRHPKDLACPLCHGIPVRARNLLRAVDQVLHPEHSVFNLNEVERRSEKRRGPGEVDSHEIMLDGSTLWFGSER